MASLNQILVEPNFRQDKNGGDTNNNLYRHKIKTQLYF